MFKTRLKYLLMRSFDFTVKQWRKNPGSLKAEFDAHLKRAAEYQKELKGKNLVSFEIWT